MDAVQEQSTPQERPAAEIADDLGVKYWVCPYCGGYENPEVQGIRSHISNSQDENHKHKSGHAPDKHIPGYNNNSDVVAVITAVTDESDESIVSPGRKKTVPDELGPAQPAHDAPVTGTSARSMTASPYDDPNDALSSDEPTQQPTTESSSSTMDDSDIAIWLCPYCEEYTSETIGGIKSHINGNTDAAHEGKSGWNPDKHIPGYTDTGDLIAVYTASPGEDETSEIVSSDDVEDAPTIGLPERLTPSDETEEEEPADPDELGVAYWQCPYCTYTSESDSGIRSHINGNSDEAHDAKSGWNPADPIFGYSDDDTVVAKLTIADPDDEDDKSIVQPADPEEAPEQPSEEETTESQTIRGPKKIRLTNAWYAARTVAEDLGLDVGDEDDVHYTDVAAIANTGADEGDTVSDRYAHRIKSDIDEGDVSIESVEEVVDDEYQETFVPAARDILQPEEEEEEEPEVEEAPEPEATAGGEAAPSPAEADSPGELMQQTFDEVAEGQAPSAMVAASDLKQVRDRFEEYRREGEWEAEDADEPERRERGRTKQYMADRAIQLIDGLIDTADEAGEDGVESEAEESATSQA